VSAAKADVQLFWGEPLDGVAGRIGRLRALSRSLGREHAPLQFGLRITTVVRDTTEEAWRDAEEKVARMAAEAGEVRIHHTGRMPSRPLPVTRLLGTVVSSTRCGAARQLNFVCGRCWWTLSR
jgi:alkanesulfonate monooxygenase SsuD/methylene tetrahydromethanopterin reductase-like flavin-dependent oxidoreductase (luciferase family)